ncbi:MAG TPA: TraB/GumN family protein, partial [Rhodanobacteraceae bacterium]
MRIFPVTLALLITCAGASAQTAARTATSSQPVPPSSITTLQVVTVTGVVPGPGLWKVTHGDHVLWILGVVP